MSFMNTVTDNCEKLRLWRISNGNIKMTDNLPTYPKKVVFSPYFSLTWTENIY